VAGYNVNSFYLVDRPPFLQAELLNSRGEVIASTGNDGAQFEGIVLNERVQKVQRYSFQGLSQRSTGSLLILMNGAPIRSRMKTLENEVQPLKKYLPRRVPYTRFTKTVTHHDHLFRNFGDKYSTCPISGKIAP
jgi:hypothetical protein